jgi:nitrite reductase (NO-forming)
MPHNIDLHTVPGLGGSAASSFTAPEHESQFSFKAITPRPLRLSLRDRARRHTCGERDAGLHPRRAQGGTAPVDKEFYVMKGDFLHEGQEEG